MWLVLSAQQESKKSRQIINHDGFFVRHEIMIATASAPLSFQRGYSKRKNTAKQGRTKG
jgi:hypothetical protein